MKKTDIRTAFLMLLVFLLLFSGCHTVQTETSDEDTQCPVAESEFSLPDTSYLSPEEEKTPIQSQPPVETKPTPWAIVKVASELPMLTPEPTKTVTLPDKIVTATYIGKEYTEIANTTPRYAYEADNGDVLQFDAVGGELVCYERAQKQDKEEKNVSLAQAQVVAETFARQHIDLSRYKPARQDKLFDTKYCFQYVRYIGDMPTQDMVNIDISVSGELLRYWSNPHIFDCIQIGTVDKDALRQRFEEALRAEGESMDYTLEGEGIGLNDLGEPCVIYSYYYDRNDGRLIAVNTIEIPLIE